MCAWMRSLACTRVAVQCAVVLYKFVLTAAATKVIDAMAWPGSSYIDEEEKEGPARFPCLESGSLDI